MPRHQLCVFLLCPPDQLRQLKYHLRLAGPDLVTRATVPYSYSSRSGLHTIRTGVSYLGYMLIQGVPVPGRTTTCPPPGRNTCCGGGPLPRRGGLAAEALCVC
jgi:hypothetical protein